MALEDMLHLRLQLEVMQSFVGVASLCADPFTSLCALLITGLK